MEIFWLGVFAGIVGSIVSEIVDSLGKLLRQRNSD
jgi:hypothetical protein